MTSTLTQWIRLVARSGSNFTYVRDFGSVVCPCRTPQGFRDDLWHKSDNPDPIVISPTAGTLSGSFLYRVHFIYPQGEKVGTAHGTGLQTSQRFTLSWSPAMEIPPAGKGPATSVRIYRKRTDVPSQPWLLVTEILDPIGVSSFMDNSGDNLLDPATMLETVCNDAGFLPDITTISAKGFIQPVQSGAVRRLVAEVALEMFGEFEEDDHIGLIPCVWKGHTLTFKDWSETGTDRIFYNDRGYTVVAYNLVPDPADGNPFHHWEVGLRMVNENA